jgi:hypothetical protein
MSLRAFHLFFIALSVVLAAFTAAWAVNQYRVEPNAAYIMSGLVSLAAGAGLAVYGTRFQRKTRNL